MSTPLTRQALYELVWSRPRTALAKELGISDVAIGKHCARAMIPAPPPGYWARLSAGGSARRTPLPIRLPGQSVAIEIGHERRVAWNVRENLDEPLSPPVFEEELEMQVCEALKLIGRVAPTRDLQAPDAALSRLLAAEAKRRAKREEHNWSLYKPYFDEPMHQRQLRIFNSIARALSPLYGRQEVHCMDQWTQGIGTRHYVAMRLNVGAVTMNLQFFEPSDGRREGRAKPVSATTLGIGTEDAHSGAQEWSDTSERKLEAQLTEIVSLLLRRAEASLRAHAQRMFEHRLKRREEERLALEAKKREEEKKRLAAIQAKRLQVRDEIVEIARRRSVAEEIRSTVEALRSHPETIHNEFKFQAWAQHAMKVADSIDPLSRPIEEIIGSFDPVLE